MEGAMEWLDCNSNYIGYQKLTDNKVIENVLNLEKSDADECDKQGNDDPVVS